MPTFGLERVKGKRPPHVSGPSYLQSTKTYKPPSEDGDLSKNTVAQEAETVKVLTEKQP